MSQPAELTVEIDAYLERLFCLNRSLTGDGNRQTLRILSEIAPIETKEYPCSTQVYDWVIPDEWSIHDAWIKDSSGEKIVDWQVNNLHIVGYSAAVDRKVSFEELAPRLHYFEDNSGGIPYRTSYYDRQWGFCVTQIQYEKLRSASGELEVYIGSDFNSSGSMTVGEIKIAGRKKEEFLVSTYLCHPSMANDNLSGLITTAILARAMLNRGVPEHSWRFVFVPETIGAIAYLKFNELAMKTVHGGFVVTCCGGPGALGYKETYIADHLIDRAVRLAFRDRNIEPLHYRFVPDGSDERQYSSPGFRIPVASITKDKYYEFPEYHTSLDNLEFVSGAQVYESLTVYEDAIRIVDENCLIRTRVPNGEAQLGRRGLYPKVGGAIGQSAAFGDDQDNQQAQLDLIGWVLFLADGNHDLIAVAERSKHRFEAVQKCVALLLEQDLIELIPSSQAASTARVN